MILSSAFLLCLLVAVDGSAIKGRLDLGETKGRLLTPLELRRNQQIQHLPAEHRELSKTSISEERREETAQRLEDLHQQREEITQIKQDELPAAIKAPLRPYEAKPQIRHEELAKGQQIKSAPALEVQRPLLPIKTEEQRRDDLALLPDQAKLDDLHQQREELTQRQEAEEQRLPLGRKTQEARLETIKGTERREEDLAQRTQTKLELSKTSEEAPRREEQTQWSQLPEQQTKLEDIHQQREEIERPARHEQAKGQQLLEQRPLAKGQERWDSQREEALKSTETRLTAERKTTEEQTRRIEQQRDNLQQTEQVVDLNKQDYEQRRLEDTREQRREEQIHYEHEPIQQHQQQIVQLQQHEELRAGAKGGAALPAFAEAEPYAFDYSVEGSSRRESGDTRGTVRGQYTVLNGDGSQRIVDYVADRDGFRAQVNTGELGTENQHPAGVILRSSQPAAQDISLRLEGKTREFLTAVPQAPLAAPTKSVPARPDNWNLPTKTTHEQRKGGEASWESWSTKGREQQHELIRETDRAPILVTHQQTKSLQRTEELPLRQEALKQELPLRQEPLKQELPLRQEPLRQEGLKQELPLRHEQSPASEPIKSTELARTPKALAELKSPVIQARSSFESATAHRPIVHSYPSPPVVHLQPASIVRQHHQQHLVPAHRVHVGSPVRNYQHQHHSPSLVAGLSRSQYHHDRYPPPPSAVRAHQPLNPRVSFYANNFDDEQPSSVVGFEQPINSS